MSIATTNTTIRLACMVCDREDYDGISSDHLRLLKSKCGKWTGVHRAQSYREATTGEYSDWWTHLGWCPRCARYAN